MAKPDSNKTASTTIIDPFELAIQKSREEGVKRGVHHFDSKLGNSVVGYFLGIMKIAKGELSSDAIPDDNRRAFLSTVYIRESEHLIKRTANPSAVQHFHGLKPGCLVRLTCTAEGVEKKRAATFSLDLLATREQVAEALGGDITEISGLIE